MKARGMEQFFLFSLDEQQFALHLDAVEKVLRMVEITPLPEGPDILLGVVNLQGRVIPVVNLRTRFHLPQRETLASDYLLVTSVSGRTVSLWVDAVGDVIRRSAEELTQARTMGHDLHFVEGAVKLDDGIILVIDLDAFLDLEGRHGIDEAVAGHERSAVAPEEEHAPASGERKRILRKRAKALAQETGDGKYSGASLEVVEFLLAYEHYAVEAAYVREVFPLRDLTPLPCTPPFILGIANVRGQILAIIDLKQFFEIPTQGLTEHNKLVVLKTEQMEVGVLADEIHGVRFVPVSEIHQPPVTFTGVRAEQVKGVTKDRLVVLDAAKILADERIRVHEEVEG